jgi:hypothetical protein
MPQQEQTSLEKAFLDFQNLKDAAKAELMDQLDEEVTKKLLALMNEELSSEEAEQGAINEDVTVTVKVDNAGDVSVDTDGDVEAADDEEFDTVEPEAEEDDIFEVSSDAESYEIANEMNHLDEQEPGAAPAPAPAPAPEAAPDAPAAEAPAGGAPEDQIIDGIKALIAQDGGGAAPDAMAGDEIDIIDDAPEGGAPAQGAAPAPEAPVAEEFDVEEIFEIIDDIDGEDEGHFSDDDITMDDVLEDEDLYEITLELDEDDSEEVEEIDEMKAMGHSHSVQRGTGDSAGPEVAVKNRSRKKVNESTAPKGAETAHYEAKVAELNKENESLKAKINEQKEEIKKFHKSFVELRSQFNEMQTFNAKLAYANKLFANGGFSEKEKLQIAESFDQVDTVDAAKKLYNSIISENKLTVKNVEREISATPSRAAKPKAKAEHEVLYESDEMRRMRELAGIKRLNS